MAIYHFQGPHGFLSNFFPASITHNGISYPTSEHLFQASKTTDVAMKMAIADQPSPSAAKRVGRTVRKRAEWDEVRIQVMADVLALKFDQNPDLARLLRQTKNELLVEGNDWNDTFWGAVRRQGGWHGDNWLGKLLMLQRALLRAT